MRKKVWIPVVALLALAAAGLAWWRAKVEEEAPLRTMAALQKAIVNNDQAALERLIDAQGIREQVKAQLKAERDKLLQELEASQNTQSDFLGLVSLFASLFSAQLSLALSDSALDEMAQAFTTPKGLASVGSNKDPEKLNPEIVYAWTLRREGPNQAFIHYPDNPQEGLVLEKVKGRWIVTRIRLAEEYLSRQLE
jgi:hypothetical protein